MNDRFYYDGAWNETLQLQGTEAHHLCRVLRKQPGDLVELFNGRGEAARAVVTRTERRSADLEVQDIFPPERSLQPEILLATAAPKGDRFRWLIEKGTELGVDRLVPLKTARSVVEPGGHKLEKLQQTVIAACKQSGRNRLMQIDEVTPLDRIGSLVEDRSRLVVGSPGGNRLPAGLSSPEVTRIVAIVGPEGGLTEEEREFLHQLRAEFVSVSPYTLRIETAGIALATLLGLARN